METPDGCRDTSPIKQTSPTNKKPNGLPITTETTDRLLQQSKPLLTECGGDVDPVVYKRVKEEERQYGIRLLHSACTDQKTEAAETTSITKKEWVIIANRGEIAESFAKAAKAKGMKVAVIADPRDLPWTDTSLFDKVIRIENCFKNPGNTASAVLRGVKILEDGGANRETATAVPGYGLWSEDKAAFAVLEKESIHICGPKASHIALLGDKAEADKLAEEAGLDIIYNSGKVTDTNNAISFCKQNADSISVFLLKATDLGGGAGQLPLEAPKNEAEWSTFQENVEAFAKKYPSFKIDQYLGEREHIEFQVISDSDGNIVLGSPRNCTIQRAKQKYIEETAQIPKEKMEEMSKKIRALFALLKERTGSPYTGAATVEFLYDPTTETFHFLEVNTRIQVEHPVSGHQDGIDYPTTMLDIGNGMKLRPQEEMAKENIGGHTIEARICLEELLSETDKKVYAKRLKREVEFAPANGQLKKFTLPKNMEGVCIYQDSRIQAGVNAPGRYDSMVAKVVVHADSRPEAIHRLREAVLQIQVEGVGTNIPLILKTLDHPEFQSGDLHKKVAPLEVMAELRAEKKINIIPEGRGLRNKFLVCLKINDMSDDTRGRLNAVLRELGNPESFAIPRSGTIRKVFDSLRERLDRDIGNQVLIMPEGFDLLVAQLRKSELDPKTVIGQYENRTQACHEAETKTDPTDTRLLQYLYHIKHRRKGDAILQQMARERIQNSKVPFTFWEREITGMSIEELHILEHAIAPRLNAVTVVAQADGQDESTKIAPAIFCDGCRLRVVDSVLRFVEDSFYALTGKNLQDVLAQARITRGENGGSFAKQTHELT